MIYLRCYRNISTYDYLNQFITDRDMEQDHWAYLTKNLHILPDFHGNRSPIANHNLKGMVCGLTLTSGLHDLALQYLATLQGLAVSCSFIHLVKLVLCLKF